MTLRNPNAVGFGTATAEEPPYPAQEHLNVTDDLGGGGLISDDIDADHYTSDSNEDDDKPGYDATVDAIESWVADHPDEAQEYLDAENAKSKPRSSLVDSLQATVDAE